MISETIKRIRKEHYLNQTEFANKIGVTQGAVSQWENGLTRPNLDQLRAISTAFSIPINTIVDGTDRKLRNSVDWKKNDDAIMKIFGSVMCGLPNTPDPEIEEFADIMKGVHADFALRCKGDSMQPTFNEGDIVLIRQQPEVENGQIAAVNIDGETTLKHVYKENNGLMLVADNTKYKPLYVPFSETDPVTIHGLAVGYVRLLS